MIVSE
jgi:hypothetical protein